MDLLDLYAGLTLDTKDYERSLKQAEKDAQSASKQLDSTLARDTKAAAQQYRSIANTAVKVLDTYSTKITSSLDRTSKRTETNLTKASKNVSTATDKIADTMVNAASKSANRVSKEVDNSFDDGAKSLIESSREAATNIERGYSRFAAGFDKEADKVESRAKTLSKNVSKITSAIGDALNIDTSGDLSGSLMGMVGGIGSTIGGVVSKATPVLAVASTAISAVTGLLSAGVSVIKTVVSTAVSAVTTVVTKVAEGTATIITTIGGVSVKAAEVGAAVVASATAAAAAITKLSLEGYGEYEQLAGGIETLFGEGSDASKAVKNFAKGAFKAVQMSESEYMSNVMSFSATLLQSLSPEEAAEKSNKALTQIADNANKMGTSIDTVAYAYKGLAKNNATMLDNLQLGYGGTNAELARLINDSGVLNGELEATADNVNEIPFAKVIDAIGIIQDRLHMTGVSADEAEHTIEGSINTLKAAWANLVAGFGNPEADIDELTANVLSSVDAVSANVLPAVDRIIKNVGTAIKNASPEIRSRISTFIKDTLPTLVDGGLTIATTLGGVLVDTLPDFTRELLSGVSELLSREDSGDFIRSVVDALLDVASTLADYAPQIITAWYGVLVTVIDEVLSTIASDPQAFAEKAAAIILAIGEGIVSVVETIAQYAGPIADGIIEVFTREDTLNKFKSLGERFIDAIAQAFDIQGENGGIDGTKLAQKLVNVIVGIGNFFADNIGSAATGIGSFIDSFVNTLLSDENKAKLMDAGRKILEALGLTEDRIKAVFSWLLSVISSWISDHQSEITAVFTTLGKLMWQGIWNGLSEAVSNVALEGLWEGVSTPIATFGALSDALADPEAWDEKHKGQKFFDALGEDIQAIKNEAVEESGYDYGHLATRRNGNASNETTVNHTTIVDLDETVLGSSVDRYSLNKLAAQGW